MLAVLSFGTSQAWATAAPTTTTLTVTSSEGPVTSVAAGTVVTLTATVVSGSTPVNPGQVKFCDAAAAHCEDSALLATPQLTAAGIATFKFRPGAGSHSYQAIFVGTGTYEKSSSTTAPLTVSAAGLYPTTTAIAASGMVGDYTLTETVTGPGNRTLFPTGNVWFVDKTNGYASLGIAALGTATPESSFTAGSPSDVGTGPTSVAVGDFNGDGIPDLAVANSGDNTVTVLLGNGDGTFTFKSSPAVGDAPYWVAVGDFNGDGIPDLAVANCGNCSYFSYITDTVTVLLGNGDGTFATKSSPTVGMAPEYVAVGDFNGDGILDLVSSDTGSNTLTVLLGNGDGTFTTKSTSTVGNTPKSVLVADFNGDGILDLAVANFNDSTVTVLLGNGDGTFTTKSTPGVGSGPIAAVVGDFNGDGIPDLATANTSVLTVLLGKGDGTFTAETIPIPGAWYVSMAVDDFNGDGIPDLALSSCGTFCGGSQPVPILLGNGDGTFTAGPQLGASYLSYALAVGDFNGDGAQDLASASYDNNTVTALLNQITETATATLSNVSVSGTGTHLVEAQYIPGDFNYSSSTSSTVPLLASAPSGPLITSISPNYGAPAAFVSITGAGFGATQGNGYVVIGNGRTEVTSWSAGAITIRVPSTATTGNLYLIADGKKSNTVPFTVNSEPSLSSISTTSGAAGTPVTFTGTNLTGTATAIFNGAAAAVLSNTGTQIQVDVPTGATSGQVFVEVNGIALLATDSFTVPPRITSASPNYGAPAATITLTGTAFGATQGYGLVIIGGARPDVIAWSDTSITFRVPSPATTGNIVVETDRQTSNSVAFTRYSEPSITGLSVNSGPIGTSVTITGNNLLDGENKATASFSGIPALISSDTSGSIQVTVPAGATTGRLLVKVNGVAMIATTNFNVTPAAASSLAAETSTAQSATTSAQVINCSSGFASSGACGVAVTGSSGQPFQITNSQSAGTVVGSKVDIIPAGSTHVGSGLIYQTAVNVQAFSTTFTFIPNGWNLAFVLQNNTNPNGGGGGNSRAFAGGAGCEGGFYQAFGTAPTSANNIFALELDQQSALTNSNLVSAPFTYSGVQIYHANQSPCNPNDGDPDYIFIPKISTSPVPLNSPVNTRGTTTGDTYSVTLRYNGTVLNMSMYDVTAGGSCPGVKCFTQSWTVNILSLVGGNTAYVGFTGSTNAASSYPLYVNSLVYNVGASPAAATPTFLVPAGTYTTSQSVTISDSTSGATIYYTTNVTTPTTSSSIYSEPITVSSTETLKAIAIASGYTNSSVASATYTINPPAPTITGISPNNGAPAAVVSITGNSFGATQGNGYVVVGRGIAEVTSWSAGSIIIRVPSTATTGNLYLIAGGHNSNGIPFTVNSEPSLSGISTISGAAGTPVTFTGTNLTGTATVTFNGAPAAILSNTGRQIQVTVPTGATSGKVFVEVNGIALLATNNFFVPLSLSNVSPNYGAPSASITLTGSGFGATQGYGLLTVGGARPEVTAWSGTSITFRVPSNVATGNIVVNTDRQTSNSVAFTRYSEPSITGLSVSSGPIGTSVTITGKNLLDGEGNATATFSGTPAVITSDTSGSIDVTVPTGAITGRLLVKVNGVAMIATTNFTVTP